VRTRVPLGQPYSLDRAPAHHPAEKTRSHLSVSHCRHVRPPPAVEEHCALPALGIAMAYGEVDGELREAVLATHLEPFSLKSLGEIVANRVLDPCCRTLIGGVDVRGLEIPPEVGEPLGGRAGEIDVGGVERGEHHDLSPGPRHGDVESLLATGPAQWAEVHR